MKANLVYDLNQFNIFTFYKVNWLLRPILNNPKALVLYLIN